MPGQEIRTPICNFFYTQFNAMRTCGSSLQAFFTHLMTQKIKEKNHPMLLIEFAQR